MSIEKNTSTPNPDAVAGMNIDVEGKFTGHLSKDLAKAIDKEILQNLLDLRKDGHLFNITLGVTNPFDDPDE